MLGPSEATEALIAAYKPGRTFAQAFADFYARIFAAQGLLIVDASSREFHRLGAPVLRAAIERADEFHAALVERSTRTRSRRLSCPGAGCAGVEPAVPDR